MKRNLSVTSTCSALLALSSGVGAQGGKAVELLNPGFEGEYKTVNSQSDAPNQKAIISGQIAEGWSDNSNWAEVNIDYARDTVNPHRGQASQRLQVKSVNSGAVQFVQNAQFSKGRVQVWRIWMRGRPGNSVSLIMRQAGAPYKTFAEQTATLSAEWKEFRVFGVIPEDAAGFLMIRVTNPQQFWVDDSSLEDVTSAASDAPKRAGNLLTGGNFEAGMPFGWSVRYEGAQKNRPLDPRPTIDKTSAAVGQQSLRCDVPAGNDLRVASPIFGFNHGRKHTLSVWMKAQKPDTRIDVQVQPSNVMTSGATLSTEWKRYTFPFEMPYLPVAYAQFRLPEAYAKNGNAIWFDGVQIEENETASENYSPAFPLEMSWQLPRVGHVVFSDENVGVRVFVGVETSGQLNKGTHLKLESTDLGGKTTKLPDVPLSASTFALPKAGNGMWKLSGQLFDVQNKPVSNRVELVWARLPRPKTLDAKKSYFGLHLPLSQRYFNLARRIGVRRTRLHDTSMVGKWSIVENEKGRFDFLDEGIDLAQKNGIEVLGMLDGAPAWTTTKPREGYWGIWNIPDAPGATESWDTYVRQTVGHFKGRIDQWEIWNEPWGHWWIDSGNPNATHALYAELSRRAYTNAKAVNPNAQILGLDTYPGNPWTNAVLPLVTPKFYDGLSYHEYNDAIFGGPDAIPFLRRTEFDTAQKQFGAVKPRWNTEGGLFGVGSWYAPEIGGMPTAQQAAYIVRYDVTHMAAGVRAFWLYALHTDPAMANIETTTTEFDSSVKPILAARAVLASLVDGAGTPKRREIAKDIDCYDYPNGISVLWNYGNADATVNVPRGVQVLDVWGNALKTNKNQIAVTNMPIYWKRK